MAELQRSISNGNLEDGNNSSEEVLYVITRTGKKEPLDPNQITKRLQTLIRRHPRIENVNPFELMIAVTSNLKSMMTTYEIDEYASNIAASMSCTTPPYAKLAARIVIDNHQKNTSRSFLDKMRKAYLQTDDLGNIIPILSEEFFKYIEEYQDYIEPMIDYSRDFLFDFFGFATYKKMYSLKVNNKPIERPQDTFMRVAIAVNMYTKIKPNVEHATLEDIKLEMKCIKETYDVLSMKYYTHATPTNFNAGLKSHQYASCFLLGTDDSEQGIMQTAKNCATISKRGGGIGIHVNNLRSKGRPIRGTGGISSGLVSWLRIYDVVLHGFNQGGKRPGAGAIYLMLHHPDIEAFLKLKLPHGIEEERARNLYYSVWVPDIFMERLRDDGQWSLFDPDLVGDLSQYYDAPQEIRQQGTMSYSEKYLTLEKQGKYQKQVSARYIWDLIVEANKIKGSVYICFSDHVNRMNMHSNIGTVRSSNLCVSGDTLILTNLGYVNIASLASTCNGRHLVYNGEEFTLAQFAKTNINQQLLQLTFSDGTILKCTKEHKFTTIVKNTDTRRSAPPTMQAIVQAMDLKVGAQLINFKYPKIDIKTHTLHDTLVTLTNEVNRGTYKDGIVLVDYKTYDAANTIRLLFHTASLRASIVSNLVDSKTDQKEDTNTYYVQITNSTLLTMISMCNQCTDKQCKRNANPQASKRDDIQLEYKDDNMHTITHKPVLNHREPTHKVTLVSKVTLDGLHDTFCFNEPKLHRGIFNGVISNNCSEIVLYSDDKEYAVCVLCSISLPEFVYDTYTIDELALDEPLRRPLNHEHPINPVFEFKKLVSIVKIAVTNLNHVIDKNDYPTIETRRGSMRHRPIGIGIQGLADAYIKMRMPYDSEEARKLNKLISETIYYAALSQSTRLCREEYKQLCLECEKNGSVAYTTYQPTDYLEHQVQYTSKQDIPKRIAAYPSIDWNGGSPISHGMFHWELYGLKPDQLSGMYDWETLRQHIKIYGVKNSHLVALMPTTTTSSFLGNNECFEPYTSNLYKRKTLVGEFIMINKWLIYDLYKLKLWNNTIKDYLIAHEGSVQYIDGIPEELKLLYKTAWEINPSELIQQAIDRQPFVDQAQSLNWYLPPVDVKTFTKLAVQAWKGKLKTAKYYLHSKPAITAQRVSIPADLQEIANEQLSRERSLRVLNIPTQDEPICDLCSS
jgi:ribonucleotide reductase alpha subunit